MSVNHQQFARSHSPIVRNEIVWQFLEDETKDRVNRMGDQIESEGSTKKWYLYNKKHAKGMFLRKRRYSILRNIFNPWVIFFFLPLIFYGCGKKCLIWRYIVEGIWKLYHRLKINTNVKTNQVIWKKKWSKKAIFWN